MVNILDLLCKPCDCSSLLIVAAHPNLYESITLCNHGVDTVCVECSPAAHGKPFAPSKSGSEGQPNRLSGPAYALRAKITPRARVWLFLDGGVHVCKTGVDTSV